MLSPIVFMYIHYSSNFPSGCRVFLNFYEQFSNRFITSALYGIVRANMEIGENGMLDLAFVLACLGLLALPFLFMGYVRLRVRHALRAVGKVK
jgi:hypothetical protein